MTGFLFWLFIVAPLRFDKSDTSGSILELSIRAGFAVRFSPLRWERVDQPSRHGLAFAFEIKLAPPRVMDSIFKPLFSMTGAMALDRESCQFALSLMKIPMLLQLTWALQRPGRVRKIPYDAAVGAVLHGP